MDAAKQMASVFKGRAAWLLHGTGLALTFASLVFVGVRIVESANFLATDFTSSSFLTMLATGTLIYSLLCGLIGLSWVILVRSAGGKLGIRDGLLVFARSQILKYVPSNVLHLVGRYGMAHGAGASHASLLFATAAETGLLLIAASSVSVVFALPLVLRHVVATLAGYSTMGAVLVALLILIAASGCWLRRTGLLKARLVMRIASVLILYVCFFLLNGTLLLGLVASSSEVDVQRPLFIIGVAAAAWLGGFVVPGAPAGLGVREVILTSGLAIAGCESIALTVAVGYRIITLGGDVIVALAGFVMRRR
jgi:hypothetical protein